MLTLAALLLATAARDATGFWAARPVSDPSPPAVRNVSWIRTDVDRFILARLEEQDLEPAGQADKATLLRRVTFDLTGLPPTEAEIRAFLADDAFEKVVERLLASPRYGERWGRHWLDVARYADSTGSDEDHRYPYAYRYRDYVINAFNDDLPYDQFVREQIAGDLLPGTSKPPSVNARGIVATGFLALGPKALAQQDRTKMRYDVYDEQVDVTSRAFMGLTVACARCHDHKFDPITSKDYYSMVGIFASTKSFKDETTPVATLHFSPLAPGRVVARYQRHARAVAYAKAEIEALLDEAVSRRQQNLASHLAELMVAARRVYQKTSTVEKEAIDAQRLRRWVEYLTPREPLRPHLRDWQDAENAPPESVLEVSRRYEGGYRRALDAWRGKLQARREEISRRKVTMELPPPPRAEILAGENRFFYDVAVRDGGPFFISEGEREKTLGPNGRKNIAALRAELARLESTAPVSPALACAVAEGTRVDQKVFLRGDYRRPGDVAPPAVPRLFGDELTVPPGASGRLELAEWLTRPEHPLTARVMVNRVWQWHFGEGIVRTPNNWGTTGEPPTHPELLDFLARRFVESGWSIKALHRSILLSSVYKTASSARARSLAVDRENRWLSHFNRRRLDAEEIRDTLLFVDGSLDLRMGGTLNPTEGGDLENSPKRLGLSPETTTRRTVYLPIRRANVPDLLRLFDFGDAVNSLDRRQPTTVASQALFFMNGDLLAERAQNLAKRLLASPKLGNGRRLERAHLLILNRPPSPQDREAGYRYVDGYQSRFGIGAREAWESYCRALLSSNAFLYVD